MAVKKTQLYASLWASCDKLRGGMDSSEYKEYILTLCMRGMPRTLGESPKGRNCQRTR